MTDDLLAIARRKLVPSEHDEQARLFQLAGLHEARYPDLKLMFAVPNGGHRQKAVAGKLKAEGVKPGVPDVFLPAPRYDPQSGLHYCGLFVEMKRSDRGVSAVTPAQREWHEALITAGYEVVLAFSGEEAWRLVESYVSLPKKAT